MNREPVPDPEAVADGGTPVDVTWLGHATTDLRVGPTRILTDPILRDRVAHLRRHRGSSVLAPGPVDAVLISHLHHDHLDLPSLRLLSAETAVVVPRGAGRLVAATVRGEVVEVDEGDVIDLDGTRVTAVPAEHHPNRFLSRRRAPPLGFLVERDGRTVYFPGDTDLHPVMSDLPTPDVALLPIWGWGRVLGAGHLDPDRAAQAAAILRARSVLPVHWGTFAPFRALPGRPPWIDRPAPEFVRAMQRHAPGSRLHLVHPGPGSIRIDPAGPGMIPG